MPGSEAFGWGLRRFLGGSGKEVVQFCPCRLYASGGIDHWQYVCFPISFALQTACPGQTHTNNEDHLRGSVKTYLGPLTIASALVARKDPSRAVWDVAVCDFPIEVSWHHTRIDNIFAWAEFLFDWASWACRRCSRAWWEVKGRCDMGFFGESRQTCYNGS